MSFQATSHNLIANYFLFFINYYEVPHLKWILSDSSRCIRHAKEWATKSFVQHSWPWSDCSSQNNCFQAGDACYPVLRWKGLIMLGLKDKQRRKTGISAASSPWHLSNSASPLFWSSKLWVDCTPTCYNKDAPAFLIKGWNNAGRSPFITWQAMQKRKHKVQLICISPYFTFHSYGPSPHFYPNCANPLACWIHPVSSLGAFLS